MKEEGPSHTAGLRGPPRTPFRIVEPLKYLNTHFQSRSLELSDWSFSSVMLTQLFSISTCTTSVPAN